MLNCNTREQPIDAIPIEADRKNLTDELKKYEFENQPFKEECMVGRNKYWGKYGTNKIDAEVALMQRVPSAYILRPTYLYGPMNNVYREAFVFECAMADRKFYLPGKMLNLKKFMQN